MQSLPSCCRFSAVFSPRRFHVAREMVKLLLSCSVWGLGRRKVDIIKGASHGSTAIYNKYSMNKYTLNKHTHGRHTPCAHVHPTTTTTTHTADTDCAHEDRNITSVDTLQESQRAVLASGTNNCRLGKPPNV